MRKAMVAVLTASAMLLSLFLLSGPAGAVMAPAKASPSSTSSALTTPITGTFTDATGGTGTFTGTFTVTKFVSQSGQLLATGSLTGTLTDSLGNLVGTVTQTVSLPVSGTGTCQVLHLDLGPLDLDLLGLQVHLNEVVLDITAQSGPGNLLGNLLCAVAHLLDSNTVNNSLVNLLNQIVHLL